jgi:hypothetical protein
VAYDVLAESLRLLADGVPDAPVALSRRRRFAPLAAATAGEIAATLFARRGVGGAVWLDKWTLARDGGAWRLLGGGSADTGDDVLTDRPVAGPGGYAELRGTASVALDPDRLLPWGARHAHAAHVRVSREVRTLRVDGAPQRAPRHGNVLVAWAGRRAPRVTVHGPDGRELAAVELVSR